MAASVPVKACRAILNKAETSRGMVVGIVTKSGKVELYTDGPRAECALAASALLARVANTVVDSGETSLGHYDTEEDPGRPLYDDDHGF